MVVGLLLTNSFLNLHPNIPIGGWEGNKWIVTNTI
jgi:hypothetical protein